MATIPVARVLTRCGLGGVIGEQATVEAALAKEKNGTANVEAEVDRSLRGRCCIQAAKLLKVSASGALI
jgi:hypothetical protein